MSADDFIVWRNIAIIPIIMGVLMFLFVTLCREWIKNDLREKICVPISVRWQPISWWPLWWTTFRVFYRDAQGFVHKAQCGLPAGLKPIVWIKDEIIDVA
jgi:hypothetical protein